MIGERKDGGRGGAKKISPARGYCSFRKLRSPTNGVSDWCGLTLPVNCLSISFVSFVRVRNMANSVESDVVSFDSALEESLRRLCELGMSRSQITNGAKRRNFHTGIRKRSVGSATHWLQIFSGYQCGNCVFLHTGIRKRSVGSVTHWLRETLNIYVKWD